ncbi:MAG TPA: ATP-binding protein [Gemmatimonadaceae bacterium]|nr:ATP-binding protein [Gemmatimonadaceae bacterium]
MSDASTPATPNPTTDQRELAYYKRQVDTLAGENLKLEYVISGLRHELKQKRQGFALLSQMQEAIGAHQQISSIFAVALPAIGATLGMDKAVVLSPGRGEHSFRPTQWIGFRQEAASTFQTVELEFPLGVARGTERLMVNKATPATPLIEQVRAIFELPYFVSVPVVVDERPIALLLSGRLRESKPIYPPLDQGDLDTFLAIAGLISASIRNMRVGVLEEMDRLKTEFFANISHEFRTPITLTLGPLAALLNGRYGAVADDARDQLRVMQRNQERLLGLVNQILDLAKLEAGGMRLRAARTEDFNRFVRERAAQFHDTAVQRGLEIRFALDPAVAEAELYVDRAQLDRLLVNLLSNALKFTRAGYIEVTTELRDDVVRLGVADTGIGIREDQLPHIFDRFRQADGSESREYAGTGIGLALVQEIARLHGGDVTVSSRHGEGTTFRVTLPVGRAHLDPAAIAERHDDVEEVDFAPRGELLVAAEGATDREGTAEDNRRAEAAFDQSRPTVLYAEDNPDLRHHVRDLLRGTYNVFLAADGHEGLEHARRYRPDLVLSDQMMPNMSGRDLLRALRSDESLRHVPVIFLTARAGTEARIESLQAGADDYLSKPFNEGELLARVRNLLQVRAQERQLAELNRRLEARVEEQVAELLRGGELQRFLPSSVVEQVLAGTLSAGERFERRRITVLACELLGVAELTEQLEPEDLAATLDELLREITAVVVEHGGTLDRLTSGGLLVLFGAPRAMDVTEQAIAAARTALAVRRGVQHLAASARRRGAVGELAMRAAINTGFCTVGAFGSELQRRYTAVGNPVTVAERLQEAAPEGKILGMPAAISLVESRIRTAPAGGITLRGATRPLECFEILGIAGDRTASSRLPRLPEPAFVPK